MPIGWKLRQRHQLVSGGTVQKHVAARGVGCGDTVSPQPLSVRFSSGGSRCMPGTSAPQQRHQTRGPLHGERRALLPVWAGVHLAGMSLSSTLFTVVITDGLSRVLSLGLHPKSAFGFVHCVGPMLISPAPRWSSLTAEMTSKRYRSISAEPLTFHHYFISKPIAMERMF